LAQNEELECAGSEARGRGGLGPIAKNLRNLRGQWFVRMLFQVHIDGADWFGPLPSFEDRWRAIQYAKSLLAQVPDEPPFFETVVTVRNQEGAVVFSFTRAAWRFAVAALAEWSTQPDQAKGSINDVR
jgi:hypothetical protein